MADPQEAAKRMIDRYGTKALPIPVEELASRAGAQLSFEPFEGDVSGVLFREEAEIIIGVNSAHPATRQRFTIAHELGHLLLHPGKPLIVDRWVRVNLRNSKSSLATDRQEIEANQFAAELLMPRELVYSEVQRLFPLPQSFGDDEGLIVELARRFNVSGEAMGIRLQNLGMRWPR